MLRTPLRRGWLAVVALAGLTGLPPTAARADGPLPISTNSVFYYRFDVRIGPAAFARPAGPWYSYFPVDPNLLAQPQRAAFPNWPNQFPPANAPLPRPVAPGGMSYYAPPAAPYGYDPAYVNPVGYYGQPGYWYGR